MRLVRADAKALIFELTGDEREAFTDILSRYPVVPPAHHQVSKELENAQIAEAQHLLDEALAEQRNANQRHVQDWLSAPKRFRPVKAGWRFTLERADSEWLLQVFNDIRVGSWLLLGSPEELLEPTNLDPELWSAWVGMDLSAWFQMMLLVALERGTA